MAGSGPSRRSMVSVKVDSALDPPLGESTRLFELGAGGELDMADGNRFDVTADGKRFLFVRAAEFRFGNRSGRLEGSILFSHCVSSLRHERSSTRRRPPAGTYTTMTYIGVRPTGGSHPMARTNIDIDEALVEKAMRLTGATTKREAVDLALRRLVEKGTLYRALRRLKGGLSWEGDVAGWRSARTARK